MDNNNSFGRHLTLDLSNCNKDKLKDMSIIYDFLLALPKSIEMQNITLPYVVKWLDIGAEEEGITGFVIIAESHIAIHTYPEKKYMFADVFSCKTFHVNKTVDLFLKTFEAKHYEKNVIKRGIIA